jgi:hypothetical protein
MAAENVAELLLSLTPSEQQAVREFIQFLRDKRQVPKTPFLAAVDEFVAEHPELLRRLAE